MKAKDFRRIALGLNGAVEKEHMGHPDFRANGRIFATIHADMKFGMVKLTPDEQTTFMRAYPDAFSPEAGAWGRAGCTRVRLDAVDQETLGEAMTLAWTHTGVRAKVRGAKEGGAKVRGAKVRSANVRGSRKK